jgi:hypothetical protein
MAGLETHTAPGAEPQVSEEMDSWLHTISFSVHISVTRFGLEF